MNSEKLTKNADLQRVVTEGVKIYQKIKNKFEPTYNGRFLAIDIDSKNTYMGNSSAKAMVEARKKHPGKVFYVVKIGYDAVETIATLFTKK